MPPRRSQYILPLASTSSAPLPLRGWNGVRAYVPRTKCCSRASTAAGDSSCSNKVRSSFGELADCDRGYAGPQRGQCRLQLRTHAAAHDRAGEKLLDVALDEMRND